MEAQLIGVTTRRNTSPANSTSKNGQVPPRRRSNREIRPRDHLTPDEIERLLKAAKSVGRHPVRDHALVLLGYRHGLRASELANLRWDMVDLRDAVFYVNRLKGGSSSSHPLRGVELRALRELKRKYPGPYLFVTERGGPIAAATIRKIVARAGEIAEIGFPVHVHALRHCCGYYLASKGHDARAIAGYLGHRDIRNTLRYCELSPTRFKDFWSD